MSNAHPNDYGRMLPALFQAQAVQGWAAGMLRIVDALLAGQIAEDGALLEIGCGGGQFLRHWHHEHPQQPLFGVDLHPVALAAATVESRNVAKFSQADLVELPFASASFEAIVALDVFDQRGIDLAGALNEAKRLLKPQGVLLLRVSAYPWLYGEHDVAFNTGRRFAKVEIKERVESASFRVQRITYANSLLAAPIILSRLLHRWKWIDSLAGLYESTVTNRMFETLLQWEADWLQKSNLPLGISLFVVARRT